MKKLKIVIAIISLYMLSCVMAGNDSPDYDIITIEGCQYVVIVGTGITHKANCGNIIHKR